MAFFFFSVKEISDSLIREDFQCLRGGDAEGNALVGRAENRSASRQVVGNGAGIKLAQFPKSASRVEPCGVEEIRRDPAILERELTELQGLLPDEKLSELKLVRIHDGTE